MVLGAFLFASMAVCVKLASAGFNSAELVFYRGLVGTVLIGLLARHQNVSLRTRYPVMHGWRCLVGVLSLGAWFYAIAYLPFATALTLNYMSSVWVAVFIVGSAMLAWSPNTIGTSVRTQGPLAITVLAGFAGVVLMLRPTLDSQHLFAGVVGLLSGVLGAFAYMQVMVLGRMGEPETRTVFYFGLGTTVGGAVGMAFTGISPWRWDSAVWLLPIGVLAAIGQLCITRAYGHGATLVVASLQYSGIVFGALYSLLLFHEDLGLPGWLGMALILASGVAATVLRARAAPTTPAEEP